MKPTQVAEKPLSGSRSRSRSRSGSWLGQNPIRSFVSDPKRARLDDGFFIKIPPHLLADLGDVDSTDSEAEEEEKEGHGRLDSCLICGRIVRHHTAYCPYLRLVPHNATLPPGVQRLCKCCGLRDGHPGRTDWKGFVVMKQCDNCGSYLEHWTDECPNKDRNDQ
ncbi:uncharacterized protein LOC133733630 [Rosa rugosa]|uniref:uncharacterized protein LOC133733630 n=1 Tax=Rosa rugosa TaxID=74645 RepID=UPI002B4136B4|nr:uncharacterized protein LOC133733630 [Rosa rugosa]